MAALDLYAGSELMPSPVKVQIDDEILWSEDSGRTLSGEMVAAAMAEKKTLTINWGFLTATDYTLIKDHMVAGFFPVRFLDIVISAYRGTLTGVISGEYGGEVWYESASVKVVQK